MKWKSIPLKIPTEIQTKRVVFSGCHTNTEIHKLKNTSPLVVEYIQAYGNEGRQEGVILTKGLVQNGNFLNKIIKNGFKLTKILKIRVGFVQRWNVREKREVRGRLLTFSARAASKLPIAFSFFFLPVFRCNLPTWRCKINMLVLFKDICGP